MTKPFLKDSNFNIIKIAIKTQHEFWKVGTNHGNLVYYFTL